jgi:DNA primase
MIPQPFVEQLKSTIPIVDVASQYFNMKKSGSVYQATCIHPGDREPSLTFFPETNTFHCFGCGAGGKGVTEGSDLVSFVMWIENCSFPEAVERLANHAKLPIPSTKLNKEERKKKDLLFKLLEDNRKYYVALKEQPHLLEYLKGRGIGPEEIEKFRIGYVPDVNPTRVGGRLAFPIMNDWGKTVGFSYRNMEDVFPSGSHPDTGPKYMNSLQSPVFHKGSILFGLNFIKRMIREKDYIILAEGFADTILGQKYGCPFVSMMGTSLTEHHLNTISAYTKNIYVWLDGDHGGVNATLRHLDPLRSRGFIIKVIYTPGKDPDDMAMLLEDGLEEWIAENSMMAGQFQINTVMDKYTSALTELKVKTVREIVSVLGTISPTYEKQIYANQIAQQLSVDPASLLE